MKTTTLIIGSLIGLYLYSAWKGAMSLKNSNIGAIGNLGNPLNMPKALPIVDGVKDTPKQESQSFGGLVVDYTLPPGVFGGWVGGGGGKAGTLQ